MRRRAADGTLAKVSIPQLKAFIRSAKARERRTLPAAIMGSDAIACITYYHSPGGAAPKDEFFLERRMMGFLPL